MEMKNKIRQRRLEKIRMLQEGRGGGRPVSSYSEPESHSPFFPAPERRQPAHSPPIADPELEWKRKWHDEFADYGRFRSGDDGLPGHEPPDFGRKRRFWARLLASLALFASVWGMFQWDHPYAEQGKRWVNAALHESFDTSALAAWYEKRFSGSPSFLPAMPSSGQEAEKVAQMNKHYFTPVQGKVTDPFTVQSGGIRLESEAGHPVFAMDEGRVIYSGDNGTTGYTVVIQHAHDLRSVYGYLEQSTMKVHDWIKGGETVGTVAGRQGEAAGQLYFAIMKDGRAIDPSDVIAFD